MAGPPETDIYTVHVLYHRLLDPKISVLNLGEFKVFVCTNVELTLQTVKKAQN